jgi:anaerobic dimethyl sulfoxide reductase subunit B
MNKQLGFYLDARRCIQCHACQVACKSANGIEPGVQWRRVFNRWSGSFPRVSNVNLTLSCLHCAQPACRDVCPSGAILKREHDGIVVVDPELCAGCRECANACPWGAPQFGADGIMQICNLCLDRLQQGDEPACVATCPADALFFGDMETLAQIAVARSGERLADPAGPSFFITPADASSDPRAYVAEFISSK